MCAGETVRNLSRCSLRGNKASKDKSGNYREVRECRILSAIRDGEPGRPGCFVVLLGGPSRPGGTGGPNRPGVLSRPQFNRTDRNKAEGTGQFAPARQNNADAQGCAERERDTGLGTRYPKGVGGLFPSASGLLTDASPVAQSRRDTDPGPGCAFMEETYVHPAVYSDCRTRKLG